MALISETVIYSVYKIGKNLRPTLRKPPDIA